jgi:hypothetical protein
MYMHILQVAFKCDSILILCRKRFCTLDIMHMQYTELYKTLKGSIRNVNLFLRPRTILCMRGRYYVLC